MSFNPLSIIVTLLVLTLIVAVHEFGHFITAKFFKMDVKEFAIGMGKVIWKKHYKGTNYAIRLLPIGGFVELEGETSTSNPNSFRNRPYYQKVIVLSAGVIMNMVLAFILLAGYLSANSYRFPITKLVDYQFTNVESQEVYTPITVVNVAEDSPVKDSFASGDVIVELNGYAFKNYDDFFKKLEEVQGKEASFTLIDLNTFLTREVQLVVPFKSENGAILHINLDTPDQEAYFIKYKPSIVSGAAMTYDIFVYQIRALGGIFSNAFKSGNYTEVSQSVGGIVQVAGTVNTLVVLSDYSFLVALIAFISISLAFFNILPIPALDGGHILIITIERITGRRLSDKAIGIITTAGFALLILLAILVTFKDIVQIIQG